MKINGFDATIGDIILDKITTIELQKTIRTNMPKISLVDAIRIAKLLKEAHNKGTIRGYRWLIR